MIDEKVEADKFSLHQRPRVLNVKEHELLPRGDSGDDFLTTIPFQVPFSTS